MTTGTIIFIIIFCLLLLEETNLGLIIILGVVFYILHQDNPEEYNLNFLKPAMYIEDVSQDTGNAND